SCAHSGLWCLLYVYCLRDPLYLSRFPTRRSSDLPSESGTAARRPEAARCAPANPAREATARKAATSRRDRARGSGNTTGRTRRRSEEHTSELQSRENLVCRLLLEKKKTRILKVDN